ncbi:MAG: hypothetical protein JRI23_14675 [Deltaproteobacteria bacterium]|nr:hypothetical protein [Deltaproteobacteria bacterium]MBW2532994.1 hypothetical protein [Deltaproteobacteria bacterium]
MRLSSRSVVGTAVPLVVIFLLGLWIRTRSHRLVFVGDDVLPLGFDPPYHLRRIELVAAGGPYPGLFDPWLSWPDGAMSLWAPGFDWTIGMTARALFGGDLNKAALVGAIAPVIFGAFLFAAVVALARQLAPRRPAVWLVAAAALALMPRSASIAELGRLDHHVTEALGVALLAWWNVRALRLGADRAGRLRHELLGGLLAAWTVWTQGVGLLFVGFAVAATVLSSWLRPRSGPLRFPSLIGSGAPAFALGAVLLAGLHAPAVSEHGQRLAYSFPSYLQPMLLGFGALACALAEWAQSRGGDRGSAVRRLAVRVGWTVAGVALLLLLIALLPPVRSPLVAGLVEYLGSDDPWLATIDEIRPLLGGIEPWRPEAWRLARSYYGGAACLLPFALLSAPCFVWKEGRRKAAILALWSVGLLALTLAQQRWGRPLVPVGAIALGIGIEGGLRLALQRGFGRRLGGRSIARWSSVVAVLFCGLIILVDRPYLVLHAPKLTAHTGTAETALFLRDFARPVERGARSGVLASWSHGNWLLGVGRRPVLSGGFGPFSGRAGFEAEQAAWAGSLAQLWELMERRDLGYVVAGVASFMQVPGQRGAGPLVLWPDGSRGLDGQYLRQVPLGVLMTAGSALPDLDVPHAEELCPVFATVDQIPDMRHPLPQLWVFERVRGAVLEGQAHPGSRVVVQLGLRHPHGILPYLAYQDVEDRGEFRIRFPLPTGLATAGLRTAPEAQVLRSDGVARVRVSLGAVRAGTTIAVPASFPEPRDPAAEH